MNKPLLSLVFSAVLAACSEPSTKEQLSNIDEALSSNNYSEVIVRSKTLLEQALKTEQPELEQQARLYLARGYYAVGDYTNALRFFQAGMNETLAQENDIHQALFSSIELQDMAAFDELLTDALTLTESEKAIYSQVYNSRINNQEKQRQVASTLDIEQQASPYVFIQQLVLKADNAPSEAIADIDSMLEQRPDFAEAVLYRARLHQFSGAQDIALDGFIEYEKLRPQHPQARIFIALTGLQNNQTERVRPYIDSLVKSSPNAPIVLQLRGMLALQDKEFKLAKQFSEQSIASGLESFANNLVAGVSNYQLENWEQAHTYLSKVNDYLPALHSGKRMLVNAKLKLNEPEQAAEAFSALNATETMDVALAHEISRQLISAGIYQTAKQVQDKVANIELQDPSLLQQSQALKTAIERYDLKSSLQQSLSNGTGKDADKLKLVLLYLADNQLEEAHIFSSRWLEQQPKSVNAHNAMAMVALKMGNQEKTKALLAKALELDENNLPSLMQLLNEANQNKNWQELEALSADILFNKKVRSNNVFAFWLESQSKGDNWQWAKIQSLFSSPQGEALERTLLQALISWKDTERLEHYLLKKQTPATWKTIHHIAAIDSANILKDKALTESRLQAFINSDSFTQSNELAFVVRQANSIQAFQTLIEALDIADSKGLKIQNSTYFLINSLINLNKLDEAQALLEKETEKTAINYELWSTLYQAKGDKALAWENMISSINLTPTVSRFKQLLALTKTEADREQLAVAVRANITKMRNPLQSRALLAQLLVTTDAKLVIEIADTPEMQLLLDKNYVLLNNLSWLHFHQGNVERAQMLIKKAKRLAPDNPDVIDTYNTVFAIK